MVDGLHPPVHAADHHLAGKIALLADLGVPAAVVFVCGDLRVLEEQGGRQAANRRGP